MIDIDVGSYSCGYVCSESVNKMDDESVERDRVSGRASVHQFKQLKTDSL